MDHEANRRMAFSPFRTVKGSHDTELFNQKGEAMCRVYSNASGNENGPSDEEAMRNLSLFAWAPRMKQSLEVVLEREFEPMQPQIAAAIKDLLADIDMGFSNSVEREREANREREERMRAMSEAARTASQEREQAAPAVGPSEQAETGEMDEPPEQCHGW